MLVLRPNAVLLAVVPEPRLAFAAQVRVPAAAGAVRVDRERHRVAGHGTSSRRRRRRRIPVFFAGVGRELEQPRRDARRRRRRGSMNDKDATRKMRATRGLNEGNARRRAGLEQKEGLLTPLLLSASY